MGAGKLRVRAGRGVTAVLVAALAAACDHAASASSPAAGQTPGPATPTVTPSAVPVLGPMTYGTFPATKDGESALTLCEQWAGLRGQYVARVLADSRPELEQWFSGGDWLPAFSDASALRNDPGYMTINVGFGLVSTAQSASVGNARFLDKSCAAAD